MRVIEDTADRLVLEDRPWGPGLLAATAAVLGAATVMLGLRAPHMGAVAFGGIVFALGVGTVYVYARIPRLTIGSDGAVEIATWRGRNWRRVAFDPGETWARLYRQRSRGLSSYGIKLDNADNKIRPRVLMYARPFTYAAAREAVRRINLHLKEPV